MKLTEAQEELVEPPKHHWKVKVVLDRQTPDDPCGFELEQDVAGATAADAMKAADRGLRGAILALDLGQRDREGKPG